MTEEKKGYVVVDRRLFDSEGEIRGGPAAPDAGTGRSGQSQAQAQAQRAAPPAQKAPAPARPPPSGAAMPGAPAVSSSARGAPAQHAPGPEDLDDDELEEGGGAPGIGGGPGVDFSSFVLSMATNAVMNLGGETRDGRIPGGRVNLNVAAQHIDILMMLEEKTRGNLQPEEAELLGALLYDLRMQFVTVAQRHQAPPAR